MTVAESRDARRACSSGSCRSRKATVTSATSIVAEQQGVVNADLRIGADVSSATCAGRERRRLFPWSATLRCRLHRRRHHRSRLAASARSDAARNVIKPLPERPGLHGPQPQTPRSSTFSVWRWPKRGAVHPEAYQRIVDYVKPERDQNRRDVDTRQVVAVWLGATRLASSSEGSGAVRIARPKPPSTRVFVVPRSRGPARQYAHQSPRSRTAAMLGVLSSRVHVAWALAAGGRLGVGNDPRYNKTRCFETFPFPDPPRARQGPHPRARRGAGRPAQGAPGGAPGADHDRPVQRPGEAAPGRAPLRQGQADPRAGPGLGARPAPRRAGHRRASPPTAGTTWPPAWSGAPAAPPPCPTSPPIRPRRRRSC